MKQNIASTINFFCQSAGFSSSGSFFCYLIVILLVFVACTGKMSVEEAKQVTVSMSGEAFVPPPRRIDDILEILNRPGHYDPKAIEKLKAEADASPPDKANATFFMRRSEAAISLGRAKQAVDDLRTALRYAERDRSTKSRILNILCRLEAINGNYSRAIELAKQRLRIGESMTVYDFLVETYTFAGDFKAAKTYLTQGLRLCNEARFKGVGKWWPDFWTANMQATFLDGQGKHSEAEPFRRTAVNIIDSRPVPQNMPIVYRSLLAENLVNQGRLYEAELQARQTLGKALGLSGKVSGLTIRSLLALGEVLISQGRLNEAQKLCTILVGLVEESGISPDSLKMGVARMLLGKVSTCRHDFNEAAKQFDILKRDLRNNQYLYQKLFARNPNLITSLIKTGRSAEALQLISAAYDIYRKSLDKDHYLTAELLGLRGMAHMNLNNFKQAAVDFGTSMPTLLAANVAAEGDISKRLRFKLIVETYLDLLTQIHGRTLEKELRLNALAESFRLADAIQGQVVQGAVGASGARVAVENPQLADLVRKEQDSHNQINALQASLINSLAIPEEQRDPTAVKKLEEKLDSLCKARQALLDEIRKQFPKYSDFTNPQPTTSFMVKEHLQPNETLICIYITDDHTYVWAIPSDGQIKFSKSNMGAKKITSLVNRTRNALAPDPKTLGDIPAFDIQQAYELYNYLLKPVKIAWKEAEHLIIVAHGPLGQLPFAILPTAEIQLQKKDVLFANYRSVLWLIRKVSITRQPSVSSFVTLRTLPQGSPERKAFAGFGDPFFNLQQLARAKTEKQTQKMPVTSLQKPLQVRGIRITDTGNLDNKAITSSHLGMLKRLPDTAAEISSIARALKADPGSDVFVGTRASEHLVKTMDLSDRRVIAFATHALMSHDLDGLDQPALALCSPEVTGEDEDGLLTLGEILKLKLNADWVVLSACNTGAADGAGAEAVSGLGRAFFYAGSRALLVSMWPVETTSARQLTSKLFEYQKEDKTLSKAGALRQSILALMDGPEMKDQASGKIAASYAHPFFWAPFIVVGDGQ
jgi:CHAT domain-containing protein